MTPHVTDHALRRYLERVAGFDIPAEHVTDQAVLQFLKHGQGVNLKAVREHIAKRCAGAIRAGAATLRAEGVKFEMDPQSRTVITVSPNWGEASQTRRDRLALNAGEGEY